MHRDFSIRISLVRLRLRLNLTQIGVFFNSRPCLLSLHSTSNLVLNVYSSKKSTEAWTQMKTRSFCTLQKKITCKTALFKHVTDSVFITNSSFSFLWINRSDGGIFFPPITFIHIVSVQCNLIAFLVGRFRISAVRLSCFFY